MTKRQCNNCGDRKPEVEVTQVSRKVGGAYNRAAGWRPCNICQDCVERLLPDTTRRGYMSVSRWSLQGIRSAGERFALAVPERDPKEA